MKDFTTLTARNPLFDLATLVEAGDGPDDELDGRIFDALSGPGLGSALEAVLDRKQRPNWLPHYTSSLDCVTALLERVLPGHRVQMEFGQNYATANIVRGWGGSKVYVAVGNERCDDDAPRALLSSLLRALSSKIEQEKGDKPHV